jgi:serine/threonine-protein kinase
VVKLVDFGLAKQTPLGDVNNRTGDRASLIGGTPEYISPEQIRGEVPVAQTDLYGFGVVAFESLTKRLPFNGPTVVHTLEMHARQAPPHVKTFRGDVPPALDDLVFRLMGKKITERPTSADAARQELQRIMRELNIDGSMQPREAPTSPSLPEIPALMAATIEESQAAKGSALKYVLGGAAVIAALAIGVIAGRAVLEPDPAPPAAVPLIVPPPPTPVQPPAPVPVVAPAPVTAPAPAAETGAPSAEGEPSTAAGTGKTPPAGKRRPLPEWEVLSGPEWSLKMHNQLERDEARLRKLTPPGEEPNRNAVNLLTVLRSKVNAAAAGSKKDRAAVTQSVQKWEGQFLK